MDSASVEAVIAGATPAASASVDAAPTDPVPVAAATQPGVTETTSDSTATTAVAGIASAATAVLDPKSVLTGRAVSPKKQTASSPSKADPADASAPRPTTNNLTSGVPGSLIPAHRPDTGSSGPQGEDAGSRKEASAAPADKLTEKSASGVTAARFDVTPVVAAGVQAADMVPGSGLVTSGTIASVATAVDASAASIANAAPVPSHGASYVAAVPVTGLAVEIAAQARDGKHRFEIRLDPPELGRIDVRLDVDHHGQVTSRLIVERAETLDLLRRDAPALERALQAAGLKTDGGLDFSLRDQANHGSGRDTPSTVAASFPPDDETTPIAAAQRSYWSLRGAGSGVDIRV